MEWSEGRGDKKSELGFEEQVVLNRTRSGVSSTSLVIIFPKFVEPLKSHFVLVKRQIPNVILELRDQVFVEQIPVNCILNSQLR